MAASEVPSAQPGGAFEDAQRMLESIFGVLGIRRAIVVDDQLSRAVDFAAVAGAIQALQSEEEAPVSLNVTEFAGVAFDRPTAIWRRELQAIWDSLSMSRQDEIARELRVDDGEDSDEHGRGTLGRILQGFDLRFLSLGEWRAERSALIEAAKNEPTLFLFDQDMTGNGGASDEGMKTIASLLKEDHADAPVYFGLFSHLVGANVEHERHEEFAKEYEVWEERHRFAVISKQHLQTEPRALALRLKRVAISPMCDTLKSRLFAAITAAVHEAKQKIEELEIYDFEQIVFQSSYKEGVWEADTLLRLFGLFHRDIARSKAKDDTRIREAADKVRSVIAYPYKPDDHRGSRVREIAKLDLYETGEYLLAHRMPIDVGDIFQKTTGCARYILIEQPCDLMVRGDTGRREADDAILAEVLEIPAEKKPAESFVELPFLSRSDGTKCFAKMAKCVTVPLCILDLCVVSADGTATITIGARCPASMIPAWKRRYDILQKEASSLVARYRALAKSDGGKGAAVPKEVAKVIQLTITGSVSGVVSGEIKANPDMIAYTLKRVGRLKQPRAGSLLREYAYHKARDAFDHDLTRAYVQASP